MDLRSEILRYRAHRDPSAWLGGVERALSTLSDGRQKAAALRRLARLCEEVDFEPNEAAALYRRAFVLDGSDPAPLRRARQLMAAARRFDEVAELGEIELRWAEAARWAPDQLGALALSVGETHLLLGAAEPARRALARASALIPENVLVKDALAAASYDGGGWRGEVEGLTAGAWSAGDPRLVSRMLLRAARILHLAGAEPAEREPVLRSLLETDWSCESGHLLFEGLLAAAQRWDELGAHQAARVDALTEILPRAMLLRGFARLWQRAGELDRAGYALLRAWETLRALATTAPAADAADVEPSARLTVADVDVLFDWLERRGEHRRVVELAERTIAALPEHQLDEPLRHAAARASDVAWTRLDDREAAQRLCARIRAVAPELPMLADAERSAAAAAEPALAPAATSAAEEARLLEFVGASADRVIDAWRKVMAAAPGARAPRRELARVLRGAQRWYALIEALRSEDAEVALSDEERARLGLEMVEIYRDRLRLDSMVPGVLDPLLDRQPGNVVLLDELAAWAERTNHPTDLIAALVRKLRFVASVDERLVLQLRVARLYAGISNAVEEIAAWERVLELDPEQPEALRELEAAYEKRRDWEAVVGLRRRAVARLPDLEARIGEAVLVATMAQERLRRHPLVAATWHDVLALDPRHRHALDQLARLYEHDADWPRLVAVRLVQLEEAEDEAAKLALLTVLGGLYGEKLGDPDSLDRAIDAWREVLWIDPHHERGQEALRKLFVARERWDDLEAFYLDAERPEQLIRVLERQVEEYQGKHQASLCVRIGTLHHDVLGKPDRAAVYLERALAIAPDDPAIAERLVRIYEQSHDLTALARVLELQLGACSEASERQPQLVRLARLYEQLKQAPAAYRCWLEAFCGDPSLDENFGAAVRLARELDEWEPLRQAILRVCGPGGEAPRARAIELLLSAARIAEEELADTTAAISALREVLVLDDRSEAALATLARLHEARGDHAELRVLYERTLAITRDPAWQRDLRARLGAIYLAAGAWEQATAIYRDTLEAETDPSSKQTALRALAGLYERDQAWAALEETLSAELELAPPEERLAPLLLELARLRDERLGDLGGALEGYRRLLALDPDHAAAVAAFERALGQASLELVAASALEPVYERKGTSDQLIQVCEVLLRHERQPLARASLLYRVADLQERHGDSAAALDALGRLVAENPYDPTTLAHLERVAEKTSAWAGLVQLFRLVLSQPLPLPSNIMFRCRLGHLYGDRLGELDRATSTFERVLDLDPHNEAALAALTRLYERQERWNELAVILERRAAHVSAPAERLEILLRVGRLGSNGAVSSERALAAWREVRVLAPRLLEPLQALATLQRAAGDATQLVETLRELLHVGATAEVPLSAGERVAAYGELGRLESEVAGRDQAAIEAYDAVLALEPTHEGAIEALDALYRRTGRWAECVKTTELRAQACAARGDGPAERELLLEAAMLCDRELAASERAAGLYERVRAADPAQVVASAELERIYRQLARWAGLAEVLHARAGHAADVEDRVALLLEVAQLREERLADPAGAFEALIAALRLAPAREDVHARLEALAGATRRWAELCAAAAQAAEQLEPSDPAMAAELWMSVSGWRERELAAPGPAVEAIEAALRLAPESLPVLEAAARLYRGAGSFAALAQVLRVAAPLEPVVERRFALLVELGHLHEEQLGEMAAAAGAYRAALDLVPGEPEVLELLVSAHAKMGDWEAMVQCLSQQAACSAGDRQASLYRRIAELCEGVLADRERAMGAYREWLGHDAQSEAALAGLERLCAADKHPEEFLQVLEWMYGTKDARELRRSIVDRYLDRLTAARHWPGMVAVLDRLARDEVDDLRRAGHRFTAGVIRRDELGQPELALRDFEEALDAYFAASSGSLPEAGIKAFQAVEDLLTARADWSGLERTYRHMIDRFPRGSNSLLLVTFWENLGALYRDRMGDAPAAELAFESAARVVQPDATSDLELDLRLRDP